MAGGVMTRAVPAPRRSRTPTTRAMSRQARRPRAARRRLGLRAAPQGQQFAHQREASASRRAAGFLPVQRGGAECALVERVGNLVAEFLVGAFELLAPSLADRVGERAFEVAEEREGAHRAPFLA